MYIYVYTVLYLNTQQSNNHRNRYLIINNNCLRKNLAIYFLILDEY